MPEERENDPSEMTFLEHLEEMRFVILKTLAFFSVALILVLVFFHYFNSMMLYPLNSAKNILSKWVGTEQVTEVKTERIGPVYLVSDGDEKNKIGPFFIEPKDDSIVLFKDSKPSNPWYADIKLRSMSFATPIIVYFYVGFNPHNSLFLRRVSGCAWLVAACSILLCGALHSAGTKKRGARRPAAGDNRRNHTLCNRGMFRVFLYAADGDCVYVVDVPGNAA